MAEAPNPIPFPQGQSFSVVVQLTEDDYDRVKTWGLQCEVRKHGNKLPNGLLAVIEPISLPGEGGSHNGTFLIYHTDTSKWPVGLIELDFLFKNVGENAQRLRTNIIVFEVTRTVTREAVA